MLQSLTHRYTLTVAPDGNDSTGTGEDWDTAFQTWEGAMAYAVEEELYPEYLFDEENPEQEFDDATVGLQLLCASGVYPTRTTPFLIPNLVTIRCPLRTEGARAIFPLDVNQLTLGPAIPQQYAADCSMIGAVLRNVRVPTDEQLDDPTLNLRCAGVGGGSPKHAMFYGVDFEDFNSDPIYLSLAPNLPSEYIFEQCKIHSRSDAIFLTPSGGGDSPLVYVYVRDSMIVMRGPSTNNLNISQNVTVNNFAAAITAGMGRVISDNNTIDMSFDVDNRTEDFGPEGANHTLTKAGLRVSGFGQIHAKRTSIKLDSTNIESDHYTGNWWDVRIQDTAARVFDAGKNAFRLDETHGCNAPSKVIRSEQLILPPIARF